MSRRVCETWEWALCKCSLVTDIRGQLRYLPLMNEKVRRFYGGGDLHFLTFSCYQRRALLETGVRCDLFLQILERVRRRYRFAVLGYVIMPEHVHLLVTEPQRSTLSTAIQALKIGFVRTIEGSGIPRSRKNGETWGTPSSTTYASSNSFWQARFYDFNVWTEKKRIEKLRYIHRNPVKRGLVNSPAEWPWSSFRLYLSGEAGPVKINDTNILVMTVHPRTT